MQTLLLLASVSVMQYLDLPVLAVCGVVKI